MPVHRRRSGDGEGLQPRHSTCDLRRRERRETFRALRRQIANAIAIATVDNVSLACVHAEPVSQWKGFSPGMTGMRAVYAASLAKRGFTGPSGLFEGPNGLERMFGQSIPVDWDDPRSSSSHRRS